MNSETSLTILRLKLMCAELEFTKETFEKPESVLSTLSPNKMSLQEMELELELLREVYFIFKGEGPECAPNSMQSVVDMYGARIRDLETEILERTLLVES